MKCKYIYFACFIELPLYQLAGAFNPLLFQYKYDTIYMYGKQRG